MVMGALGSCLTVGFEGEKPPRAKVIRAVSAMMARMLVMMNLMFCPRSVLSAISCICLLMICYIITRGRGKWEGVYSGSAGDD